MLSSLLCGNAFMWNVLLLYFVHLREHCLPLAQGLIFFLLILLRLIEHRHENSINSKKKRKQPEGNGGKLLEANTSSDKDYKEDKTKLVDVGLAMTIDM